MSSKQKILARVLALILGGILALSGVGTIIYYAVYFATM